MAGTTSIAGRMAELKRLRQGLSARQDPAGTESGEDGDLSDPLADFDTAYTNASLASVETGPEDEASGDDAIDDLSEEKDAPVASDEPHDLSAAEAVEENTAAGFDDFTDAYAAAEDETNIQAVTDDALDDGTGEETDAIISDDLPDDVLNLDDDEDEMPEVETAFDDHDDSPEVNDDPEFEAAAFAGDDEPDDLTDTMIPDDLIEPDFAARDIEPTLLDQEFEAEEQSEATLDLDEEAPVEDEAPIGLAAGPAVPGEDIPTSSQNDARRVAVSFDSRRSQTLVQVSQEMNCAIEDVVVTALDWYLDALYGEEDEARSA